jgi:serine protease Do
MEDIKILEAVERYITGQMSPDERVYFEQLRKSNPEVDQMVVEHTFFLQQMNRFDEGRKFRALLNDIHTDLAERGIIQSPKLKGQAKVFYLFKKYKRTTAIAASIAGITALTISALVWQLSPTASKNNNIEQDIQQLRSIVQDQGKEISKTKQAIQEATSKQEIIYRPGGTGFLVDAKGYLVTNYHVIEGAKYVAVQNSAGKELAVNIVHIDQKKDIAILKINDTAYKASAVPYTIRRNPGDIAESIYTLGYPKNDIVYGQGYLAARTGNNGDTLTCQITVAANPGNSGGPVFNNRGEVIGVISTKQKTVEGAVFAVQSRYILQVIEDLKKQEKTEIKIPSSSNLKGMDRVQQVKKISDYVYMVKVN